MDKLAADGVKLIPYLTGHNDEPPHNQLFWRKWEQNAMCIREGDIKLVSNGQHQNNTYQLFNIEDDISEKNDLHKQSPEKSQQLLEAWEAELKDRTFPTLMGDKWWVK